jgi:hypothetical protein
MYTITSFHASSVHPEHLSGIMADYLALDRARIVRRLLVTRFGLAAFAVAIVRAAFQWMSSFAAWCTVALLLVPPAWAWIVELHRDRQLARRLRQVPGAVTEVITPTGSVRKS